jgi:hypothetical protein
MMRNIAQNDQKSTRIILGRTGFFNRPLVLELWLIVDQVALIQSVAYALWYTVVCYDKQVKSHLEPTST